MLWCVWRVGCGVCGVVSCSVCGVEGTHGDLHVSQGIRGETLWRTLAQEQEMITGGSRDKMIPWVIKWDNGPQ